MVRQPDECDWTETSGDVTYHVWEGTREAIYGQKALCKLSGYTSANITSRDNVVFRLRAGMPGSADGSEDITETWEIDGNAIQEDIFSHPNCDGGTGHVSYHDLSLIKQSMNDPTKWENSDPNFTGEQALASQLHALIKRDQRSYQRSFYVLRYSMTGRVGNRFDIFNPSNVDKIFTYALLPRESISRFPAILDMLDTIDKAGTPYDAPAGYTWGWLMQAAKCTQAANAKMTVTQDWWLYCWSAFIYDMAVSRFRE